MGHKRAMMPMRRTCSVLLAASPARWRSPAAGVRAEPASNLAALDRQLDRQRRRSGGDQRAQRPDPRRPQPVGSSPTATRSAPPRGAGPGAISAAMPAKAAGRRPAPAAPLDERSRLGAPAAARIPGSIPAARLTEAAGRDAAPAGCASVTFATADPLGPGDRLVPGAAARAGYSAGSQTRDGDQILGGTRGDQRLLSDRHARARAGSDVSLIVGG